MARVKGVIPAFKGRFSSGTGMDKQTAPIGDRKQGINTLNGVLPPLGEQGNPRPLKNVIGKIQIAEPFAPLFTPECMSGELYRYIVLYGGRASMKSWTLARLFAIAGAVRQERFLCAREFQVSIKDSVIEVLKSQIRECGLKNFYNFGTHYIEGKNGTEFVFKGLRHNVEEIKSLEGITKCWVEEAQSVSKDSWDLLIPTIRLENSQILVSFNPNLLTDATYQRFVVNTPPKTLLIEVNWSDNPWFSDTLNEERLHCLRVDPDAYNNIWEGKPRTISNAVIFKGKYRVDRFEAPQGTRFFYGADWGFAEDPTTLVRCYIEGKKLFIDYESYALHLELDHIGARWRADVPGCARWPVKADSANPATISHVKRQGFQISGAKKWPGSVIEGIRFMRSFEEIVIHERCKHTRDEFGLYSYKQDRITGDILPDIVDMHNHCIDAIRYALDGRIRRRGGVF